MVTTASVVAMGACGAAIAGADGGGDDRESGDRPITGTALQRASSAALEATGGGRVTGTEVGDEESYYEVEVTRADGSQVDVQLDRGFRVVSRAADHEEAAAAAAPAGPRDVSPRIDNPYLPFAPGSRWVYRETAGDGSVQRVVVTATRRTRRIANGMTARVVRDTVTERGHLVEDTFDWYVQDRRGNVWYVGEDTKEYEGGKVVTTKGSWEAGVGGARPGLAMPARPRPGREYSQERFPGEAEDMARVLSIDDQAEVPAGHYRRAVLTKEWNPLEPRVLEYKLYAPRVGVVLELGASGGADRAELLSFER
jgi:hypothetical protein